RRRFSGDRSGLHEKAVAAKAPPTDPVRSAGFCGSGFSRDAFAAGRFCPSHGGIAPAGAPGGATVDRWSAIHPTVRPRRADNVFLSAVAPVGAPCGAHGGSVERDPPYGAAVAVGRTTFFLSAIAPPGAPTRNNKARVSGPCGVTGSDQRSRYCSLSFTPSHSSASGRGSLRSVMFGHTSA